MSTAEARARASRIKLVLSDADGVLTDAGVYYSEAGEALKRFSLRDGMGVERLRQAGVESGIVTGEVSECLQRRAEKLQLRFVFLGIRDKQAKLAEILETAGLEAQQIAFIGDDWNDLDILHAVNKRGLTAAPADAITEVAQAAHFITKSAGGHGAFRDFADWILSLRPARASVPLSNAASPADLLETRGLRGSEGDWEGAL